MYIIHWQRYWGGRGGLSPPTLQRRQLYTWVGDSHYSVKNVALCELSSSWKFNLHLLINSTCKFFLTELPHFLSGVSASVIKMYFNCNLVSSFTFRPIHR